MKTYTVELNDPNPTGVGESKLEVEIEAYRYGIEFKPNGYGDYSSFSGVPFMLEYYEGRLRLLVWDDINKEGPSHIIDLEKARESNRINRVE